MITKKVVLVDWEDSCSASSKWHDHSIGPNFKPSMCQSVGWILYRDKKTLVLAASMSPSECGDVTAIPASCVKKIKILK